MRREIRLFSTLSGNYEAMNFVEGIPSGVLTHFPKDQWLQVLMALSRAIVKETAALDWSAVERDDAA